MSDIAVVIGNYRGARFLPGLLASIAGQTRPPGETIVVDAGSTDESPDIALRHGARVVVTENRGLGHLYNVGSRAARAPLVLLLNNDLVLDERCVEHLAQALEDDECRFAADPLHLEWEGDERIHGRATISRGPPLRQTVPGFRLDLNAPAEDITPTLAANGAAMLVRRERLLELGGFDERFFMEYEDLDLCWRAWLRGWSSVHVPAARLRHHVGGVSTPADNRRRILAGHRNVLRFAVKCLPWRGVARLSAGELARLPRHPWLVAQALAAVALELPELVAERRRISPRRDVYEWLLAGQPGAGPFRPRT